MKSRLIPKRLFLLMLTACFSQYSHAAAFQLWEQDGASIGNYHAGRAAIAADASTAFYNPAGLVNIKNQQVVVGLVPITMDFKFDGNIAVGVVDAEGTPTHTTAQGGTFNLVPDLHYAAPLLENLVFGFSAVVPFGLNTNYGKKSIVRYAGTLTSLQVIDVSPSLGFAITDKLSVGAGLDINKANLEVNMVATLFNSPLNDTDSTNTVTSQTAFGYHVGLLYQFSPKTRIGLAYQSKTTYHFRDGDSKFEGPLANLDSGDGGLQESEDFETDMVLPSTTTLSIFHNINPAWDVMATVSYTQWHVFDEVVLKNVAGIDEENESSNNLTVVIPQNYRNTWNYAVGANYHINEEWFLRGGLGYDQTPSNDHDRNIQLPDADRYVAAIGVHYQALKTLGFDLGWSHFFAGDTPIDVTQQVGAQVTSTDGNVHGNADVYGFQVTWDIV